MRSLHVRSSARVALAAALLSSALACRSRETAPSASSGSAQTYTIRGEVTALPAAGRQGQLMLRHEPIHDFKDASGKVVGMDSMVMGFDLAPNVSAADLRVGDRVEAGVTVDFSKSVMRIDSLRKLDPGTQLRFGKAEAKSAPR